ncbi:uncharacterized protein AMSG_08189 [Thecamonas trahens ATCC 50062]|uniref:PPIase cyclophilin-type domain-containing protein n=1 Tax=Thecamonas trahens ATCC 50062 TaxID=461836 RepID=A0A0L0DI80_THETB|nr:hypothetical protein AMSG_08189 [Thecamonas trahens ATCC 50062]KNC51945.1 hypothetical protein AMSG_08189 [Thecamonas trahens ATCC 50062]|eukprot:XP_013755537.1 hypothetical protein AMSG_08189 [Thecamonas trahens ATCC 50062]
MSANETVSHEPATSGKMVVHTSKGDVEVELWAREARENVRNVLSLAAGGAYDGCGFFRIDKESGVVVGDPTDSGTGGFSINYDPESGSDSGIGHEFHKRIKFAKRGIVACMASPDNRNRSQLLITLAPLPDLDGKATIIGKVVNRSLFTIMAMTEMLINEVSFRPEVLPTITSIDITVNPFLDLVPATHVAAAIAKLRAPKRKRKRKRKAVTNAALLSFGSATVGEPSITLRDDDDDDDHAAPLLAAPPRIRAVHDVVGAHKAKAKAKRKRKKLPPPPPPVLAPPSELVATYKAKAAAFADDDARAAHTASKLARLQAMLAKRKAAGGKR